MNADELKDLLTLSGYQCRVKGAEVVVQVCIFCGNDRWNLEINPENGFANCWVCRGTGGRADAVIAKLTGEVHHIPVTKETGKKKRHQGPVLPPAEFKSLPAAEVYSAARYLKGRGVTPDIAVNYGLRVCLEVGHLLEGRIAIPARDFWTGVIAGWVGRSYTGGHPKYLSTMEEKMITGWRVRAWETPCVVVEGHMDGIAVHQAGFHAAVLSGTGAGGVEAFVARLPPTTEIVVMLDGSAIAQAKKLFWKIQAIRPAVRMVVLPTDQDPGRTPVHELQAFVSQAIGG